MKLPAQHQAVAYANVAHSNNQRYELAHDIQVNLHSVDRRNIFADAGNWLKGAGDTFMHSSPKDYVDGLVEKAEDVKEWGENAVEDVKDAAEDVKEWGENAV
eukprot:Pgem_evm1s17448